MGRNRKKVNRELEELRTRLRRIERLLKIERNEERKYARAEEYSRLARLWREKRDLERREEADMIRKRFWDAHYSGNAYLAWKLARYGLDGKGGGIRTSATQGISRENWEYHFSGIYGRIDSDRLRAELTEIEVPNLSITLLDYCFSIQEVREVLENKRNHRAPGPDGLRVDFLRILRYDDVVCAALANLFTIMLRDTATPVEWERAYLFILYKGKGDKNSPDAYRGITLKSHMLKLFEAIIARRLSRWLDEQHLLPVEQLAYRKG